MRDYETENDEDQEFLEKLEEDFEDTMEDRWQRFLHRADVLEAWTEAEREAWDEYVAEKTQERELHRIAFQKD